MLEMADWFEDYAKRNRVFVLGAGFSAAAGVPMIGELLTLTMEKFRYECPGVCSRVEDYVRISSSLGDGPINYGGLSFANLCTFLEYVELREYAGGERWSDAGCREKLALKYYLAKTIVELTPSQESVPQLYLNFAKQLHYGDIVLTFNWDSLLEVGLRKLGKSYTYNFEKDRIQISKMHGSVNWRLGKPRFRQPTLDWLPLGLAGGLVDQEVYSSLKLHDFGMWNQYGPLGEVEPFIVLPGVGKAQEVRSIATFWYKVEFVFATTNNVYIIGLALSPDDFFIRSFFLHNLPYLSSFHSLRNRRIVIINRDPDVQKNYDFVLRNEHAEFVCESFSDKHVDIMASEVS